MISGTFGCRLIIDERQRQINAEGYDHRHDDEHVNGEIALAAVQYALPEARRELYRDGTFTNEKGQPVPVNWPWRDRDWKPNPDDRVRELVKAGALIAAEIDRELRKRVSQ